MTKRDIKFSLTDLEVLHSKKITEEAALKDPQRIYHEKSEVYEWEEAVLTHEDIVEALLVKQTEALQSIRNICAFFAALSVIFLIIGLIFLVALK